MNKAEEVLIALRRVIRATDIHSRYLAKTIGLTSPQILLLQTIEANKDKKISELAQQMSVSQSTATNILARLESRGLVRRQRSTDDKRKVHVSLTEQGRQILASAPIPLQDKFTVQFEQLQEWEQSMIISAIQRVASMMDATEIDASPLLHLGNIEDSASKESDKSA
ncbi:MarR family transcriptional regulator [Arenicella chitinivorans]|uniref:MarR family transcriptional regulator n=1 Tax=Arenicella chitinivorans TaxID=1329800 RepID=A0A918S277_9GAMM|nr:MarR family transcriptional regulator [Arenicella chitinivorans]GHA20820.1 MarR family transcriptional regulator [Arenicella chitinivorans]